MGGIRHATHLPAGMSGPVISFFLPPVKLLNFFSGAYCGTGVRRAIIVARRLPVGEKGAFVFRGPRTGKEGQDDRLKK